MKTKRLFVLSVLAAGALFAALPAVADHEPTGEEEKRFHIHGEIRVRGEYMENFFDLEDDEAISAFGDDEFGFWPFRVRIGADGKLAENVRGYVELQGAGFFGNEDPQKSFDFPPNQAFDFFGSLGDDINLYQGFLELQKIGGSSFSVRLGRQEHTYGTELLMGDNDFYAGLAFDGGRGWWSTDRYDVNLFYYKVLEENVFQDFGFVDGESADKNFFGGTLDWKVSEKAGTFGAYLLRFQDLDSNDAWWDVGARFAKMPSKDTRFDWNVELVFQNGEESTGSLDIKGFAAEGWFGYTFGNGPRHRVHVGGLIASGDDDPTDTDEEDFIPLFGDNHAWNRLGDADFFTTTNITDWNVGYNFTSANEKHSFFAAFHKFTMNEELGAIPVNSFFVAPFVPGEDDLGTEFDLKYSYLFAENTKLSVGVSNLAPGDAFGPDADDVLRVYAQARVRW
jgi:hypothetical protein